VFCAALLQLSRTIVYTMYGNIEIKTSQFWGPKCDTRNEVF